MVQAVGIVGGGIMGCGIAEGRRAQWLRRGTARVQPRPWWTAVCAGKSSLDTAVRKGKLTARRNATTSGREIRFTDSLDDLADRDLVAEAVIEDEDTKTAIASRHWAKIVRPDALITSNTSSIPIMKLAAATQRRSVSSACTSSIRHRCFRWSRSFRAS